ncbi:ABC transporter ATP-binding protein [Paenibacillus lautus]|uniref:ABC transporter ATP-binding protein n=1 Tax=Paenibacillus lautus TaxID=1401 RepID=UPI000BBD5E09|nr:ATP-binding cassette domain-containing protein [Paenibacillus lautus]PCL90078.1 sugar ABC transporter ATP-binding protein [Paenibacillus lautus]
MIQVCEISKRYKKTNHAKGIIGSIRKLFINDYTLIKAVEKITFSIGQGEAVGYLGPNGAGKSTMIKMLTGILVPTSGFVTVNGLTPHKNRKELAKRIGIVFGQRSQLWWDLPVIDSFELHKRIYKISEQDYKKNMNSFLEQLGLEDYITQPVRQLSLGQRMRAEIALALLHNPDILFLDEPTIGLDVLAKEKIRAFINQINRERNVTILLTSHDLKDIEQICNRMLIVNKGALIFDGTVEYLKTALSMEKILTIDFESDPGTHVLAENAFLIEDQGMRKKFKINKGMDSAIEFVQGISKIYPIRDFSLQESDIEDVIRLYYEGLNALEYKHNQTLESVSVN